MRPAHELSPWIQKLILEYDEAAAEHKRTFKAQVIYVDHLSPSQVHLAPGPTELLYVSDGEVHIPALLTPEAAQLLLEMEERECLSRLRFATVHIQKVKLLFYADAEETRSRFYLTVGSMATLCIVPRADVVPSCSELPAVQRKISKVWRRRFVGDEAVCRDSQSLMDLSQLLWECEQDSLSSLCVEIRDRLEGAEKPPAGPHTSPQPRNAHMTHWDADRIRFKNAPSFSVPVKFLLMPDHCGSSDGRRPQSLEPPDNTEVPRSPEGRHTPQTRRSPEAHRSPQTRPTPETRRSPEARRTPQARQSPQTRLKTVSEDLLQESSLLRCVLPRIMQGPAAHQWDLFPPPWETSSSSDASGDDGPRLGPSAPGLPAEVSQPSDLPPYQDLQSFSNTSEGPAESQTRPSVVEPEEEQVHSGELRVEGPGKRSGPAAEGPRTRAGASPLAWICETPDHPNVEDGPEQAPQAQPVSSQVTQQNMEDFSRFTVPEWLQRWAVQYLLPKPP
ncbi:adrenocortical dysplasia protein homolog [Synchiropus splendidus]|uniref:adrenocortical dysplasia protein homolog n=1 Tax=Synchiropus splendidus TaxID=270530 RepID=UPI00237D7228|nr:adrenocortical dysplasia protein homolog [Synchiropus splendidus]